MPYRNRPLAKRHPALADQLFSSIEWRSPPERLSPPLGLARLWMMELS